MIKGYYMSQIVHLSDGTAIKADVVESFNKAVGSKENWNTDGSMNWNFVDSDINLDLGAFYSADYLYECFNALADRYGIGWKDTVRENV
jgi:hypothetical protein